jgi:hypothetical protein
VQNRIVKHNYADIFFYFETLHDIRSFNDVQYPLKSCTLLLAECMMSILGEGWLSEDYKIKDNQNVMPVDK